MLFWLIGLDNFTIFLTGCSGHGSVASSKYLSKSWLDLQFTPICVTAFVGSIKDLDVFHHSPANIIVFVVGDLC